MKLHVLPPSANCQNVIALLKKLEIEYEEVNAFGATRSEAFMKMNPCHVTPTLELDDGTAIWESNTLLRYLCNISGEKGDAYYPKDPVLRAKLDMVMDWRQTVLYPALRPIGYIVFGMDMGDAKAEFKTLEAEAFPVMTSMFLKDTKFIFSDTPTIADLSVGPALEFLCARTKFWEKVPQEVKDYKERVYEAFPENKDGFAILAGMIAGMEHEGKNLEP